MHGETDTADTQRAAPAHLATLLDRLPRKPAVTVQEEGGEDSCSAFGYLRGLHDRGLTLELRFRNGNTQSFPYSWLGPVCYNPSVGLLLKFTGDVVYLVLIRGSNLDAVAPDRAVNLTDRGINRHRILWVREMDEDELRKAGQGEATIDRIETAEFESVEVQREWVRIVAPPFVNTAISRVTTLAGFGTKSGT